MAKPRIFLSSTFYDLRQVRADIDSFIEKIGYDVIRNEEGDISYGKDDALEDYCYKEIKLVDILVSIIGGRFGSESSHEKASISQLELKTALKENKQVYIFIEKNVLAEYETYLLNKDNTKMKYKYVDNIKIYQFVEELRGLPNNNNIKGFETALDITSYLKEQFAGLFQRFLNEQTRIKESNLIVNLERTAQTLNKLVEYLSDENKENADEVNKILMINHPLVQAIRTHIDIPYNFYIERLEDFNSLMNARSYRKKSKSEKKGYHKYENNDKGKYLFVSESIFEKDGKLNFIKSKDWNNDFLYVEDVPISLHDDLPF